MAYRAGWKISLGSLVANIALVLLPVGVLVYLFVRRGSAEGYSLRQKNNNKDPGAASLEHGGCSLSGYIGIEMRGCGKWGDRGCPKN
ncbi:hypothetical protein CEB3_c03770 [Peptococcaceae bacterium CEB3]|nr:hypothetical protein CEB3_c03770 [Peptococcaceae bacterium CEB3]